MITFAFVKDCYYAGDGTMMVKCRIPSVHGPLSEKEYRGQAVRNYVRDENLPYCQSLLLPYEPKVDEVVAVASLDDGKSTFIVIGLTGGSNLQSLIGMRSANE